MDQPEKTPETTENALTSIRNAYTLAGTQDQNASEVGRLMIKHFLDTLAEVALAVASRNVGR